VLDIYLVSILLVSAAIAGDAVNYSVGRYVGPKVFSAHDYQGFLHKLLNRDHLDKAHAFFEKHGGMAVVSGRFVPIVRTFVPFVAGAASMTASTFVTYNVVGAIIWVVVCTGAGYLFGNVPIIKENFTRRHCMLVSVLPIAIEFCETDVWVILTGGTLPEHPPPVENCPTSPASKSTSPATNATARGTTMRRRRETSTARPRPSPGCRRHTNRCPACSDTTTGN
jgi:membrane protein DedA with SNARE-associated domain